jgi:hypothetical protein
MSDGLEREQDVQFGASRTFQQEEHVHETFTLYEPVAKHVPGAFVVGRGAVAEGFGRAVALFHLAAESRLCFAEFFDRLMDEFWRVRGHPGGWVEGGRLANIPPGPYFHDRGRHVQEMVEVMNVGREFRKESETKMAKTEDLMKLPKYLEGLTLDMFAA